MTYQPDFSNECRECGGTPTVIVVDHEHLPDTDLCGFHFFLKEEMRDWEEWNNQGDNE